MNHFPHGIETFFPNIKVVLVYSSKLKKIKKQDLAQFPLLKDLFLHNNEIEELDDDLFASNERLLVVELQNNKIEFIGEETFSPLKQLNTLYMIGNRCINKNSVGDDNEARELIKEAKIKCRSASKSELRNEITTLKSKKIALERELKTLREENLRLKTQPKANDACAENFI
jgi:Leucine-rich repeat (LRR) protein